MSHFVVVVVGDDYEEQLAPFYEQGDQNDDFMERQEEPIDLTEARRFLKDQRESVYAEAQTYFTKHATRADGTVVDVSVDEDTLVKEFAALDRILNDDGSDGYNRYRGYGNLPPLDCDDETLVDWYSPGAELIDGVWMNVYYANPNAKWDWYQMGGRWSGFFKVKPSIHPDRYNTGSSGLMGSHKATGPLVADQATKGDIDWEQMRYEAEKEAAETYDKYEQVIAAYPEALTWDETLQKFLGDLYDENMTRDHPRWEEHTEGVGKARQFYGQQPRVKALQAANLIGFMSGEEEYKIGREEFIRRAGANSFTPFAVLMNGVWYERGEMGWFGMAHNEKDGDDWATEVDKLFQSLDDDTTLTAVDCHI